MELEQKPFYKKLFFWQIAIPAILIVGIGIYIAIELVKPQPAPQTPTVETTQATDAETQAPTLPPPPPNPYGMFDFAMEGDYLTCTAGESMLGIDVSFWQGDIDWQQVKEAGVEYAMLRIGWRGSEQGVLAEDEYAQANYAGASAAGIRIGGYFFSQSVTPEEAVEEAKYALSIIEDWNVDMPIVYDWEYIDAESRTGNVDARTLTDCTKAFCQTIAEAGYTPMIYFNENQSHKQMYLEELTDYPFWLAQYSTTLDYPYRISMWQYSDTGSVPGISGNVDLNLYFTYE